MKFEDMLLALIARKPATGYDLRRWLATEGVFIRANADQSQIYRTLNRLLARGLINVVVEKREGVPDAKVYPLGASGAQRLRDLVASPYSPPARWQEADFTAWFTLLATLEPSRVASFLDVELQYRKQQVATYRHRPREIDLDDGLIAYDRIAMTDLMDRLHDYNAAATDTWIAWLETVQEEWSARYPA